MQGMLVSSVKSSALPTQVPRLPTDTPRTLDTLRVEYSELVSRNKHKAFKSSFNPESSH